MKHGADELRLLSRLLDEFNELPESTRETWLNGLTGEAARLRPALNQMIARQAGSELDDFLEHPPEVAADAPASEFSSDDRIGPYRLLHPIGRGGMGEVWLATLTDGRLKRRVALKLPMLHVRRGALAQRFERERDILGALVHPRIARLYDAGLADDGQPYMAIEYVEGTPITEAANERALDAQARVRLLRQVMDAVQYAHANLVIHRDLKPANILVKAGGEAMLLDFGIAKLVEDEAGANADSELTMQGGRALTPRYAAPELISHGAISTAVDIWGLGTLLYELLTGLRPFDGDSRSRIEQDILTRDPARPSQRRAGAIVRLSRGQASDLDTVVLMALKKHPAERYATVSAFADDLDRWLRGEPVRAQRDSRWYRTRRFVGRHKLAVAGTALASVTVIATAVVAVTLGLQAREETARAVAARDFLVNLFRRDDSEMSIGKELSAKEMLTQSYKAVLQSMEGQPALQSVLLREIGNAKWNTMDLQGADQAFAQAALRYRRLGDLREAAAINVDRAAVRLSAGNEVAVAVDLLTQAETLNPGPADDEAFMARHAVYRSFAAGLAGDASARQSWYARALPYTDRGLSDTSGRTVLAIRILAIVEVAMRSPRQAADRLAALLARLQTDGAAAPIDILSVMVELGAAERSSGRYSAALKQFDTALALCQTSLNAKGTQCVYNQLNRSRLLLMLGFNELALEALPFLVPPPGPLETFWDITRAAQAFEILAQNRQLGAHPGLVKQIVAAGTASASEGENWQAQMEALKVLARHQLGEGQLQRALEVTTRGESLISARGAEGDNFAVANHLLHAVSLHMLGDHPSALQLLDRVHAGAVKALGAEHPTTKLFSILRARPLWALQRQQEALALLDSALPVLREAMGAQAPTFAKIQTLREELANAKPGSFPDMKKFEFFL